MPDSTKRPKPIVLIVMDGVGVAPPGAGNAVTLGDTHNLDELWPKYPHTYLEASGLYAGLPTGTDGNSEVGHMALGAGKVIFQDLPRIDNAIKNDTFTKNPVLLEAFEHAKKNKSNLHLIGLVGNGLVHASNEHLFALLELAASLKFDADSLFIHAFTDGRDSATNAGLDVLASVEAYCIQKKVGRIASVIGRAYAMDRNRNWARTRKAYDMLTQGKGQVYPHWQKALEDSYSKKVFDEYIEPCLITIGSDKPTLIKDNDAVIMFNFRPDRALQLTMAFEDENFKGWERPLLKNLHYVGMTDYEQGFPRNKAFPPEKVTNPLGKILSDLGLKQLRIAESEKFPHVTYFFDGENKEVYPGATFLEIPSPKDVATYDQKPEMSMKWVTDVLIEKIELDVFDFILVNYAGPDMVAHTGVVEKTVKAMEVCDECVGRVVEEVLKKNGAVIITSDHGNAEEMVDIQTGNSDTKHSTNQVPLIIIKNDLEERELSVGNLSDIAPTILKLMGLEIPPEMTGRDLLS
jgi:2,3-bisphosphoglycerate-independent phosphoglycerate mutase